MSIGCKWYTVAISLKKITMLGVRNVQDNWKLLNEKIAHESDFAFYVHCSFANPCKLERLICKILTSRHVKRSEFYHLKSSACVPMLVPAMQIQ